MKRRRNQLQRRGGQSITIRDVARQAGVSAITVSRALNTPGKLAPETLARVQTATASLNYVPNFAAGTLASNKSNLVGVIVPNISHPVFNEAIRAIADSVAAAGFSLLIGQSDFKPKKEEELVRTFLGRMADGLVLTGYTHTKEAVQLLSGAGVPIVEMWNLTSTPLGFNVGISQYRATYEMTLHLADHGYRNIAYIGGLTKYNDRTRDRERGFKAALRDLGRKVDPAQMIRIPFDINASADAVAALLEEFPDVDAIFGASDYIAVGALLECLRLGIDVPGRIAVAGFDDLGIAERLIPSLTTLRVPYDQMGKTVADCLLSKITGKAVMPQCHDIGFEIISRDSA